MVASEMENWIYFLGRYMGLFFGAFLALQVRLSLVVNECGYDDFDTICLEEQCGKTKFYSFHLFEPRVIPEKNSDDRIHNFR